MKLYQAETLAKNLMKEHDLDSWNFVFNNRIFTDVGRCKYSSKTLSLSKPLTKINDIEFVKNTMLHEIAHALCGRGTGHSKIWKTKCLELGIKPERLIKINKIKMPKPKYVIKCPNCHNQTPRFRKMGKELACRLCCKKYNHGKYDERFKLMYI